MAMKAELTAKLLDSLKRHEWAYNHVTGKIVCNTCEAEHDFVPIELDNSCHKPGCIYHAVICRTQVALTKYTERAEDVWPDKYCVSYTAPGGARYTQCHNTLDEALRHRDDIKGFEGITDVTLTPPRVPPTTKEQADA